MKDLKIKFILSVLALGLLSGLRATLEIGSADITPNKIIGAEFIYKGMGCNGQNISPEIHWSGAPKETKSFALTVYDPAAPTGSGFWHWVVYNIPANTSSLGRGRAGGGAGGVAAANDFGEPQYDGPCPPPGRPHPYIFTIHALNVEKIDLPAGATNAFARFMIEAATIQRASFQAYYGR